MEHPQVKEMLDLITPAKDGRVRAGANMSLFAAAAIIILHYGLKKIAEAIQANGPI